MKFSIRDLLLVTVIVALGLGAWGIPAAGRCDGLLATVDCGESTEMTGHPISNGKFHQRSNGVQRYPDAGPSDLNIDGTGFELEQKGYKFSGSVRVASDLIILDPDVQLNPEKVGQVAMAFCPTRLKDKIMLVELDSVVAFCNAVNSGNRLGATGCGAVVLERPASEKEIENIPELGNPLLSVFLRKKELLGTVSGVAAQTTEDLVPGTQHGKTRGRRATLSIGRKDGVFAGMQFHQPDSPSQAYVIAWVIEVQENRSILLMDDDGAHVRESAIFSSRSGRGTKD